MPASSSRPMPTSFGFAARFALAFSFLAASSIAAAAEPRPYDATSFNTAQAAGKPILVEIHADWCGECRMQKRVLDKLSDEAPYASLVRLRVDYDRQKDGVRQFGAKKQSTLVVYKGDKELGRAVGITSEDKIRSLVDKAL